MVLWRRATLVAAVLGMCVFIVSLWMQGGSSASVGADAGADARFIRTPQPLLRSGHLSPLPSLRVLAYNACLLPFPVAHNGQHRVEAMARALPARFAGGVDVLVLAELISPSRSGQLLEALRPHWPHISDSTHALARVSGGVRIASRYPITKTDTLVYEATELTTSDRLAAKGVVYCALGDVPGAPAGGVHVFGTHMHAPDTPSGSAVRAAQTAELLRFVTAQRIPPDAVVLLAGDFNMDMDDGQTRSALRVLPPTWRPDGDAGHTVDEATNALVGIDGSCTRGDGSCRPRIIDGVYAAAGYARRVRVEAAVVAVRDEGGTDTSDHHAVHAVVTWS